MKNEKGFAITTLLYGILAMILLLLFLILNIMSSTRHMNTNFVDTIEDRLDDCIDEELYLENCYVNGGTCDKTSYYSCLGIYEEEMATDPQAKTIASELKKHIVTSGNGLYLDPYENDRYIYRGEFADNYISFSGMLWRIIAIEPDETLKIALFDASPQIKLAWDALNETTWDDTTLNSYLSSDFYQNSISDKAKLASKKTWYTGKLVDTNPLSLSDAITQVQKSAYRSENNGAGVVGLISVVDYAKASLNTACATNIIQTTNCNNWMTKGTFWTITGVNADLETAAMLVADGQIQKYSINNVVSIYPTVYLKSGLTYRNGNGSVSTPYTLN